LRRHAAALYRDLLEGIMPDLTLPQEPFWSRSVYHLYVIRTHERDKLQEHLTKSGVGTGIHYPIPVHLQNAYRSMGFKQGDFPVTEKVAAQVLSLPMFPGLGLAQQSRVVEEIARFETSRRGIPSSTTGRPDLVAAHREPVPNFPPLMDTLQVQLIGKSE
jgi:dTDP-4-amino-4,6-dideoxygalactose transaminase